MTVYVIVHCQLLPNLTLQGGQRTTFQLDNSESTSSECDGLADLLERGEQDVVSVAINGRVDAGDHRC